MSPGSFGFALVHSLAPRRRRASPGSLGLASVHSCAPNVRQVHSGSRGFTRSLIKFARFIRVSVGSLGNARGRRDHSGSCGLTRTRLEDVQ